MTNLPCDERKLKICLLPTKIAVKVLQLSYKLKLQDTILSKKPTQSSLIIKMDVNLKGMKTARVDSSCYWCRITSSRWR